MNTKRPLGEKRSFTIGIAVTAIWVASVPRPLSGPRREAPACLLF